MNWANLNLKLQQLKNEKFQYSNKANKYLANQLQRKKEKAVIPSIPIETGTITHNPQDINNIFHNFYNNHYSSKHEHNQSEIDNFLDNLDLPTLPREQANLLDTPLTPEELYTALNKMPNTK